MDNLKTKALTLMVFLIAT